MWFPNIDPDNTYSAIMKNHDYCCGVCNNPMKRVSYHSGPKLIDVWYCRSCKKDEDEMQTRGKWIAKPVKEDHGPYKVRDLDAGFFRDQDWIDNMAQRAKDKTKP